MALAELTRGSVEKALEEAAHLGRDGFLSKYGFKPAKKYFVKWKGALYDSKAIAGAAYGHLPGKTAFGPKDFTGGEKNVGNHLQRLGFEMSSPEERNPSWTRDELILALELYVRFKGNPPGKTSTEVKELSNVLNQLADAASKSRVNYRNANGVYMKLMNFRRFDPVYQAQGKSGLSRGNKLEESVWNEFASNPKRLTETAAAIRADLENSSPDEDDYYDGTEEAEEGRRLTRAHQFRERSRKLVKAKKAACLKLIGALRCEVCEFEFKDKYGQRGEGFIEVHHALPLHQLKPGTKTRLEDLHV